MVSLKGEKVNCYNPQNIKSEDVENLEVNWYPLINYQCPKTESGKNSIQYSVDLNVQILNEWAKGRKQRNQHQTNKETLKETHRRKTEK